MRSILLLLLSARGILSPSEAKLKHNDNEMCNHISTLFLTFLTTKPTLLWSVVVQKFVCRLVGCCVGKAFYFFGLFQAVFASLQLPNRQQQHATKSDVYVAVFDA